MTVSVFQRMSEHYGQPPEQAKFYWSGGPVEVARRTWFVSFFSGVTGFETDEGLVLVDSGLSRLAPALDHMLRRRTTAPVHTAIFTQGHVDHAFGLSAFLREGQAPPRVVAHRAMPARFERYARTARHNQAINARQFGGTVDMADDQIETFHAPTPGPDTLYDERHELEVGGVRFEVHHCRGETDDHSFVWCPDRGVLCPGDLFIWAVPNAGNPQKVQRYPWDWAVGLRKMAALGAESLCPGHGGPVVGDANKIRMMLEDTAELLETIVERTLDALDEGSPPHVDIVHRVRLPVRDAPWLQPVYDEAEFIVRNVIRYYGGWWSGRPCELKPAPRSRVADEVAALAGGPRKLLARAEALVAEGDLRTACHLADYALEAAPDDAELAHRVAAIYERRAKGETSLMAINLFSSAAAYAREGRAFR
ncbi:alkyl sulfatase dimerization domain-containing protein [Paraliomyxa miuraensis]|uniref:alkyl sulfatase dimerization domain-containing protein n=1 Tax=Paraliomyxa miuraensis TaxID=376150 RepID=UPI0022584DC8|nr:alkyl sulfatase dimerization domain-containing protein [Paraliomyxa miuraensis]MCX4246300.1 MBL fold metallo-hydrolase [Paraliomyxa miuraensis]